MSDGFIRTEKKPGRQRNRPIKDRTGERFGRLTVVAFHARGETGDHEWVVRCDCGADAIRKFRLMYSGRTTSCGCVFRETMERRNTTHGLSRKFPREYRVWKDMRSRCRRPNDTNFAGYGGRGIRVCDRWDSFAAFFEDMGERPEGMTIDRIDVDGHYEPSNCRWADDITQANNKRSNVRITKDGRTLTLQEWAEATGIRRETISWRLRQGWPIDRVFSHDDFRKPPSFR